MDKKTYLYEVMLGGFVKVVDTEAQPASADGSVPAVAEVSHEEYQPRVDLKNVVATDVEDAISKVALADGQFYASVARLSEVHA